MAGESLKIFNCPSCQAPLTIRALGQTITVVCGYCQSVIDTTNENYKILSQALNAMVFEPVIPIGTRGKIRGNEWEVIGFMRRSDDSGIYVWQEYLLFHPARGFRWLTEQNGHWNYVIMTKERPRKSLATGSDAKAIYLNKEYDLYEKGKAIVVYVLGEFYWRVRVQETVAIEDYICPPEILSLEKNGEEQIWSVGEYISSAEVQTAFRLPGPMPEIKGMSPNQPKLYDGQKDRYGAYWGFFLTLLLVFQLGALMRAENKVVAGQEYQFNVADTAKPVVSPSFELQGGSANIETELYVPVVNNWFSIQAELVNEATGENYEFEQGVEFYTGQDMDGAWSEGGQTSHYLLSAVPAGTYHINMDIARGKAADWSTNGMQKYQLLVRRDVPMWGNFLAALLLISVVPVLMLWRGRRFEAERWSNSDYSPYQEDA